MQNLPDIMRAIGIGEDKSAQSLHIETRPLPVIGDNEVLVRVGAAGVNRGDCLQRMGFYPPPPGASDIMGLEFAGEIVACGAQVSKWRVGARVAALVAGGGYGEYAAVHEDHILPVPDSMTDSDAAALPEAVFTVWANTFELGRLQAGETLLIHGGSSGIGTTAIQMAKMAGAKVMVTAGTDEKCAACTDLGADLAVNYRKADFVAACAEFTDGHGADVILDMVGGDYLDRNIKAAARGGRIVNIAYMQGSNVTADFLPVMLKNLTLTGSTLRARPLAEKTRLTRAIEKEIWPHISDKIKPVVHQSFPLEQAGAAHELMESSQHIGKIILDCRQA